MFAAGATTAHRTRRATSVVIESGRAPGPRRPGAYLAEGLDRDSRSLEGATEMSEGRMGCRLDAVAGCEVVHSEPVVLLRPQWQRSVPVVEEIGWERPHVEAGQKDVPVRLERALVGREHRSPVAARETD